MGIAWIYENSKWRLNWTCRGYPHFPIVYKKNVPVFRYKSPAYVQYAPTGPIYLKDRNLMFINYLEGCCVPVPVPRSIYNCEIVIFNHSAYRVFALIDRCVDLQVILVIEIYGEWYLTDINHGHSSERELFFHFGRLKSPFISSYFNREGVWNRIFISKLRCGNLSQIKPRIWSNTFGRSTTRMLNRCVRRVAGAVMFGFRFGLIGRSIVLRCTGGRRYRRGSSRRSSTGWPFTLAKSPMMTALCPPNRFACKNYH